MALKKGKQVSKSKKSVPTKKTPNSAGIHFLLTELKKAHAQLGNLLATLELHLNQGPEKAEMPSSPEPPATASQPKAAGDKAEHPGPLSKLSLFSNLSQPESIVFMESCETKMLAKKQLLFSEGDPGDELFILEEGCLEIFKKDFLGDLRLAEIRPGGIVGEMALIEGKPRSANVRAVAESRVLALSRSKFEIMKKEHPAIATKLQDELLRLFSSRLRQTTEKAIGRVF